jgi:hypothetical protein
MLYFYLWIGKTGWDNGYCQLDHSYGGLNGIDREKAGIILVGHGQPNEWDQEFPTETEHEQLFRESNLRRLKAGGYRRAKIGLAWMEFNQPRPARIVEALL